MGLLDNFGQLINEGYASKVAERLGEDPQNVSRGLRAGASSILAGIASKTGDSSMMSQIFNMVSSPDQTITEIDPAAYTREAESGTGVGAMASRFLGDLFGSRAGAVNEVVARASGLSLGSVSAIMRFAAPMVLGFLGRQIRSLGLDQSSFTRVLSEERGNIMRAAPPGLSQALGFDTHEREVPIEGAHASRDYSTPREREPVRRGGSRWLWPAIAALVVIALFWGARSRSHRTAVVDTSTAAGTIAPSMGQPDTSMAPLTPSAPSTSTAAAITLPNGTTINVPASAAESRIFGFISDPSRPADATTWFDLDRINFSGNSATLTPDSDEQLNNVAMILKAYPQATVKIGGFTDNVGNAAANKHLSAQRASAVRAALLKKGIPASRVQAQGYGDTNPVADNSTEPGRSQNRRIAVLVLHK
jgi:outer membrane protein OmpA-like peptidoglycan-associated protein